jgi:hypothetical protein
MENTAKIKQVRQNKVLEIKEARGHEKSENPRK